MKKVTNTQTWKDLRLWIILITYAVLLTVFLFRFSFIMAAFLSFLALFRSLFYAIGIAFVLNIPMRKLERLMKKRFAKNGFLYKRVRGIAIFFTLILALVVLIVVGSLIIPSLVDSLIQLFQNLPALFNGVVRSLDEVLAYLHIDFQVQDIASVEKFLDMSWSSVISNAVAFLSNSFSGIMDNAMAFSSTFFTWFTAFMFSLYLLSGKEKFIRQGKKLIVVLLPRQQAEFVLACGTKANRIFTSFVSGQLMEACILGVLYYTTMRLFHFPYAELIATMIAVMSIVPVLGPMLAMAIGAVMILSQDALKALEFIVYYQILSQIEDNYIYPKVVGNSVGLPGLWVLLSIFVFGDLFGFIGMITAVPTAAFLYVLFAELVNQRLAKERILVDHDKVIFPKEEAEKAPFDYEEEEELPFDPLAFSEEQEQ